MLRLFTLLSLLTYSALAAPVLDDLHAFAERQTAGCPRYTIINTRGTGEPQGESSGFTTMNRQVRAAKSGGTIYNTVYAAGFSQNSAAATADIKRQIASTLQTDPGHCFILEGYSQGAAATTNALPDITGAAFNAVKGVFMIGNPNHKAGLACNVDTNGGTSTLNVNGISSTFSTAVPANWIPKTLDVCNFGDGVCDTTNGRGINAAHLAYPRSASTQNLGQTFILAALNDDGTGSGGSDGGSAPPTSGSGETCACRYTFFFCPCRYRTSGTA